MPEVSASSAAGRRGGEEAVSVLRQQLEASRGELARARQQAEVRIRSNMLIPTLNCSGPQNCNSDP